MNPSIQLKTTPPLLITLTLLCFALSPPLKAQDCPSTCPGGGNAGVGVNALDSVIPGTGINNTAVGANALTSNTDGAYNVAIGAWALRSNITGDFNLAIGTEALRDNTANYNSAIGFRALFMNTTGRHLTGIGAGALRNNTTASFNTALGADALRENTTGGTLATTMGFDVGPNTAVGSQALGSNTIASSNTAVGYQALGSMVAGFDFNTGTPTDVGVSTAVGFQALANVNSLSNLANDAFGYRALFNLTDGFVNVAIGTEALVNLTSGIGNIVLGFGAGSSLTSGDGNVYIGNTGKVSESNTIRISSPVVTGHPTRAFIAGIRDVTTAIDDAMPVVIDSAGQLGMTSSSRRFKKEIKPMDEASEAILALKPVTFHYKSGAKGTRQFGLIAEEVAQVNRDLVVRDKNGEIYTVRYDAVNAMLLNEFLKEHRKNEEQDTLSQN